MQQSSQHGLELRHRQKCQYICLSPRTVRYSWSDDSAMSLGGALLLTRFNATSWVNVLHNSRVETWSTNTLFSRLRQQLSLGDRGLVPVRGLRLLGSFKCLLVHSRGQLDSWRRLSLHTLSGVLSLGGVCLVKAPSPSKYEQLGLINVLSEHVPTLMS